MDTHRLCRRAFLATLGAARSSFRGLAATAAARPKVPIGLQMYSVRDDEKRDLLGTLAALRKMGYEAVEFWAPYFNWPPARAKEIRRQLDDLGLRCYSNHTAREHFDDGHLPRVVELNHSLGSGYVIMAHAGP